MVEFILITLVGWMFGEHKGGWGGSWQKGWELLTWGTDTVHSEQSED
jgi:hypothetical protein